MGGYLPGIGSERADCYSKMTITRNLARGNGYQAMAASLLPLSGQGCQEMTVSLLSLPGRGCQAMEAFLLPLPVFTPSAPVVTQTLALVVVPSSSLMVLKLPQLMV